jgi:hypothetical protein
MTSYGSIICHHEAIGGELRAGLHRWNGQRVNELCQDRGFSWRGMERRETGCVPRQHRARAKQRARLQEVTAGDHDFLPTAEQVTTEGGPTAWHHPRAIFAAMK